MRVLLSKEFRALVPIIFLVLILAAMDDVLTLWSEFPDQKLFATVFDLNDGVPVLALSTVTVSLILALGLFVRESDEGTLAFLDPLPVTRLRVFAAKVLAALAVMTLSVIVELGGAAVFDALSRNSLSPPFPWRVAGVGFGLHWVVGFTSLGLLLPLSFLRRWQFLVLGVVAWGYVLLAQWRTSHLELLNPFRLANPAIHEGRWLVPTAQLAVQLGLGIAGFALALAAFQLTGDRTRHLADRLRRSRVARVLSVLGLVAIAGVWIALLVRFAVQSEAQQAAHGTGDPVAHYNTPHYAFLYRQGDSDAAWYIGAKATEVHDRVVQFLGATPLLQPITVDTTSLLARHNAGQAYWKKIRMQLTDDDGAGENDAVLGHETAHVYLDQLSDYRLAASFDSTRWFHEGLASYVEYRFFRSPDALAKFRRSAAVAHAWEPVKFEELAKDTDWTKKRDRDLIYPLGEIFCAALVQIYGDGAPGQIARAFIRPKAPKDLAGATLWQDTLQACGFNLEAVLAAWRAELERLIAAERPFIDSLPRLHATVTGTPDEIVLTPAYSGTMPGKLVCVTRASADAAEYEHDYWRAKDGGTIEIPRGTFSGTTFWYQLGWRVEGVGLPLTESWVETPVP